MDRLFKGAKLIEDADISSLSKREKGHLRMLQNKFKKQKQNYLIQSTEFPGALPDHLDCEFIKVNELGQRVFAFKPTQKFQNLYDMYEVIKNTHDPNELIDFCHVNPFYPQALYDLSEFFRLKGNYKEANRLLERMLYLYEESFSYDFDIFNNDTDKIVVLDYDYNSFTQLFLKGIFKFIAIITKKGCYQSALEYCKLLLKLSPAKDPMGALMYIDHVSISAKKFDFFEDFASNFASQYLSSPVEKNKYSICLYPNIIYSLSLIKFYRLLDECHTDKIEPNERLTKVEATLAEDITLLKFDVKASHNFWICLSFLLYPKLLISILQETELNKQSCSHSSFKGWQKKTWTEILEQAVFLRDERDYAYSFLQIGSDQDTEGIEKVIRIYAERNKVLWRNKFVNLWLKSIVGHFFNLVDEGKIKIDPIIETLLL